MQLSMAEGLEFFSIMHLSAHTSRLLSVRPRYSPVCCLERFIDLAAEPEAPTFGNNLVYSLDVSS